MLNIGSQFVKSNPTDPNAGTGVDNGRLEYSWMEYTAGTPSNPSHSGGTGYTQALSAHTVDNWIVRNNLIKNLHTPDGSANLWNPAILFWNYSQNNIVENNTLINTDRAIGMGLIDQATGTGQLRRHGAKQLRLLRPGTVLGIEKGRNGRSYHRKRLAQHENLPQHHPHQRQPQFLH